MWHVCFLLLVCFVQSLQWQKVSCSVSNLCFPLSIHTALLVRKTCCLRGRWRVEPLLSENFIQSVSDLLRKNPALSCFSTYFIAFTTFHSKSTNKSMFQVGSSVSVTSYCWLWKHITHQWNVSLDDSRRAPDQCLRCSFFWETFTVLNLLKVACLTHCCGWRRSVWKRH